MHTKLIILDRDGTINRDSDDYIKSPDEWLPLPGSIEAIARLCQAGWHIAIASNQSGLGRGLFDLATLNLMHDKMNKLLAVAGGRVDAIFFCPHLPQDNCQCRKPLPGLFEQIGERFGVALDQVHAVGDTLRDAQAAAAVGCPHRAGGQHCRVVRVQPDGGRVPRLAEVAAIICMRSRCERLRPGDEP
jgi:D-glycero-D-manno-heptose 1,7-bisphosphate phosphatase